MHSLTQTTTRRRELLQHGAAALAVAGASSTALAAAPENRIGPMVEAWCRQNAQVNALSAEASRQGVYDPDWQMPAVVEAQDACDELCVEILAMEPRSIGEARDLLRFVLLGTCDGQNPRNDRAEIAALHRVVACLSEVAS